MSATERQERLDGGSAPVDDTSLGNEPAALPDWLCGGALVAEFAYGRGRQNHARHTRVIKIGKRDVVLENGSRYNVRTLQHRVGGDYGTTWYLRPRTDPQVRQAFDMSRRRRTADAIGKPLDEWIESGSNELLRAILDHLGLHLTPVDDASSGHGLGAPRERMTP